MENSFPKQIFKAYDIRGFVEGELSNDLAYRIGRAFAVFLREKGDDLEVKKVVVGKDMRVSSPEFAEAVIAGLVDEGANVVDVGLLSTPLFNFACANYEDHVGGIMVTASHNPAEYNGFKMTMSDGLPVGKNTGMDKIRDLAEKNEFTDSLQKGAVEQREVLLDYLDKIFSLVNPDKIKPLRIVIDAGNGMGKVTFVELLKRLPVEVEYLFLEPDGTFPNHEANPLKVETLEFLQEKVISDKADFGFALDGDADRIGLVDEKGQVVPASFVGALIGLEVLANSKIEKPLMYCDLRSSKVVREVWEANGARTALCPVGHALIKKIMKDNGGLFASELSLHLFFKEMFDVESSDLALLYILKILSNTDKKLSELVSQFDKYSHSGEINFHISDKEKIFSALREKYGDAKIDDFDGVRFEYPTWWFSVRTSNTEPVLRLNLEADTKDDMEQRIEEVKMIINGQ
jgi:phosphomannomutase